MLPKLAAALPRLQAFACNQCTYNAKSFNQAARLLPADLPNRATSFLTELSITNCKDAVRGALPADWGNWKTLQKLNVEGNR